LTERLEVSFSGLYFQAIVLTKLVAFNRILDQLRNQTLSSVFDVQSFVLSVRISVSILIENSLNSIYIHRKYLSITSLVCRAWPLERQMTGLLVKTTLVTSYNNPTRRLLQQALPVNIITGLNGPCSTSIHAAMRSLHRRCVVLRSIANTRR
jgi:hypothetical protein